MHRQQNKHKALRIIAALILSLIVLTCTGLLVSPHHAVQAHRDVDDASQTTAIVRTADEASAPIVIAEYTQDGNSRVWGFFAPSGSTITVTVTAPDSTVLATATTWEGSCEYCGPERGYQIDLAPGVVAPGNTVTADFGNGITEETVVVSITATIDADADIITGTAPADAFLFGDLHDREGVSQTTFSTTVDPSGVFTISHAVTADAWDIQPGDEVNIYIPDSQSNQTHYALWLPYSDLEVGKWTTSGGARPGGRVVYGIYYTNRGNGAAEAVQIVDLLPPLTILVGETSGFAATQDDTGTITWTLGTLDAGAGGHFFVTLGVDDAVPEGDESIAQNCVAITTTTQHDVNLDNNVACSGPVSVWDDEVEVNIETWPNPEDPVAGQMVDYTVRTCNGRGVAAGPVWLTDTLPLSTTLISWVADPPYETALWEDLGTGDGQLQLYAAGLPGDWCSDIILSLEVDPTAPLGMELQNTVIITTPEDAETDNNLATGTAVIGARRTDLYVEKRYDGGVQTPGGGLGFGIRVENQGNTATPTTITDTLPSGLTYVEHSTLVRIDGEETSLEPTVIGGNTLIWNVGTVPVNGDVDMNFYTSIADTMPTGAISNLAEAYGLEEDDTPHNNQSSVSVQVFNSGPNLAVYKTHEWHGEGQIGYNIRVQNIGDTEIENVLITDTYPVSTTFAGWGEDGDHPFDIRTTDNYTDGQVIWNLDRMAPGWGFYAWLNVDLEPEAAGVPMRWYTNTLEATEPFGDPSPADNVYQDVAFSGGQVDWVDLEVSQNHVWACGAGGPITVTTATQEESFDEPCFDWYADTSLNPGDTVTVAAGAGTAPVIITIPTPFEAIGDSQTDSISGQIGALDTAIVEINIADTFGAWQTQTDDSGHFTTTIGDIPRGGQGDVLYRTEIGYADVTFHKMWLTQDVILRVNYGHDWVEGQYEAGHTAAITLTDSGGSIKATAVVTTGQLPDWNPGDTGFSTNISGWTPPEPDIEAGDHVYATMDNGYTSSVAVGAITGNVTAATNSITGTVAAGWLTEDVLLVCEPWGAEGAPNPQSKETTITPNGSDQYSCAWDAATEWDLLPGQDIAVRYTEPDGDLVYNVFAEPTPYLRLSKWSDSHPAEGGNIAFTIEVRNDGDAAAENVVITDTLEGMTYITDTSGIPRSSTTPLVWDLGTLTPDTEVSFQVFAEVQANAGETITNSAMVTTDNPYDQGEWEEKQQSWSDQVWLSDTDINVGLWPWTDAPAPGENVVFTINLCNNGNTASGEVVLTHTLPASLTLSTWWPNAAGWQEVISNSHQIVASIPSIGGYQCSQVNVIAVVDAAAWPEMEISATATAATSADLDLGNNQVEWMGNVGWPITNLVLEKNWAGGQLVPGGEIRYNLHLRNDGNQAINETIRVTDTLPVGTSFAGAWTYSEAGRQPYTPVYSDSQSVVWELGGLNNGFQENFEVVLIVDSLAAPGTTLTNCAVAAIDGDVPENNPYDNRACVVETLGEAGPNLRITKYGNWENEQRINYSVQIENIGTLPAAGVLITDTLPATGVMDQNWGIDYGRWWTGNSDGNTITATLERLDPGESAWLYFGMDFTTLDPGTLITNTAEITTPDGDVNPADNVYELVMTAGPNLAIAKWANADTVRPGDLVTFTVHYTNNTPWSLEGPVWITDTLPAELSFVSAQQRFCGPTERFCDRDPADPASTELSWLWGEPVYGGEWNDLIITTMVVEEVTNGTVLTNRVVIASGNASDLETAVGDNTASAEITVNAAHTVFLPLVLKPSN